MIRFYTEWLNFIIPITITATPHQHIIKNVLIERYVDEEWPETDIIKFIRIYKEWNV